MPDHDAHFVGKVTQKAVLFGPTDELVLVKAESRWTFPGGTFEYGETLVGSLIRELEEELGLQATIGPPVEAIYGGWFDDETGDPMVAIIYRAETHSRAVDLGDEHRDYTWVSPDDACLLLRPPRYRTAVRRALELGTDEPFAPVVDPYHEYETGTDEILSQLRDRRLADRS